MPFSMRAHHKLVAALSSAFYAVLAAQTASAQSADAQLSGTAQATVVEPTGITATEDLRFGSIMQPTSAGTVTVGVDSSITATGGAVVGITTPQNSGGRGAGQFSVEGDPNRLFIVFGLNTLTISSGSSSMIVDQLRANLFFGFGRFNGDGDYLLSVGGRLRLEANQPTGDYSGTYDLTVLYL